MTMKNDNDNEKMFYLTINTCMYITYYILENVNINRSGDYY